MYAFRRTIGKPDLSLAIRQTPHISDERVSWLFAALFLKLQHLEVSKETCKLHPTSSKAKEPKPS
jgi:hypothetical protein